MLVTCIGAEVPVMSDRGEDTIDDRVDKECTLYRQVILQRKKYSRRDEEKKST